MPEATGLVNRINTALQRVFGRGELAPTGAAEQSADTTITGTMTVNLINAWSKSIFSLSSERANVYDDVEEMDNTVEEINAGMDLLASTVLAGWESAQQSFQVQFADGTDERIQALVADMLRTTHLSDKSYGILREALLHGDKFLQPVVDRSLRIVRVMQMPVRSMYRNEDDSGLLKEGTSEGEFAFEQRYEKINQFIAGFYPWQIIHLRWNRKGESAYGRSLLYSSRASFKKLRAMEEALTVNWLTRAFARLVFTLDHTGLSDKQRQVRIKEFQESLLTTKMADGSTGKDPLTVVKDIYLSGGYRTDLSDDGRPMPMLTDVKAVDTGSAGYRDLSPIKYYLRKMLRPLRIPPAFLGIEDEVNARATLDAQKEQFASFIRWIQAWYSMYMVELFDLALILQGFDPLEVDYEIAWPAPFKEDERLGAQTEMTRAQADKLRLEQGVIDSTWIATKRMGMSDEEWAEVRQRITEQAAEIVSSQASHPRPKVKGEPGQATEEADSKDARRLLEEACQALSGRGVPITPANLTYYLLEQTEDEEGPSAAYATATEAYREGLQAIYDKWAVDTAQALAQIDPEDTEEFNRKLDDALTVLLLLLHQHGEGNIDKAFYLGYGGREVGPDGLRIIQTEIENNYYYLETSLKESIRERIAKDVAEFRDQMRADRREEAIALLLAMLATRKGQVDLYAGQFWHALWAGWTLRQQQVEEKARITWNLDPMARHCKDCLEYAGEYADMNELLAATGGVLPGQGTECDGNCRCWLDEV